MLYALTYMAYIPIYMHIHSFTRTIVTYNYAAATAEVTKVSRLWVSALAYALNNLYGVSTLVLIKREKTSLITPR
jgi:membrane protease YdiL (CAAX protease family)